MSGDAPQNKLQAIPPRAASMREKEKSSLGVKITDKTIKISVPEMDFLKEFPDCVTYWLEKDSIHSIGETLEDIQKLDPSATQSNDQLVCAPVFRSDVFRAKFASAIVNYFYLKAISQVIRKIPWPIPAARQVCIEMEGYEDVAEPSRGLFELEIERFLRPEVIVINTRAIPSRLADWRLLRGILFALWLTSIILSLMFCMVVMRWLPSHETAGDAVRLAATVLLFALVAVFAEALVALTASTILRHFFPRWMLFRSVESFRIADWIVRRWSRLER